MCNRFGKGALLLGLWLICFILLASCGSSDPTGPVTTVEGNTAPVTVINTTGSNSAGGTAPCGATTISNVSTTCPTTTTTTTNGPATVEPVLAPAVVP